MDYYSLRNGKIAASGACALVVFVTTKSKNSEIIRTVKRSAGVFSVSVFEPQNGTCSGRCAVRQTESRRNAAVLSRRRLSIARLSVLGLRRFTLFHYCFIDRRPAGSTLRPIGSANRNYIIWLRTSPRISAVQMFVACCWTVDDQTVNGERSAQTATRPVMFLDRRLSS